METVGGSLERVLQTILGVMDLSEADALGTGVAPAHDVFLVRSNLDHAIVLDRDGESAEGFAKPAKSRMSLGHRSVTGRAIEGSAPLQVIEWGLQVTRDSFARRHGASQPHPHGLQCRRRGRPARGEAMNLSEALPELTTYLDERMTHRRVPGAVIGIVLGKEELIVARGVTSVEHPLEVDATTLFQVGSRTKTFTGTALMRQRE